MTAPAFIVFRSAWRGRRSNRCMRSICVVVIVAFVAFDALNAIGAKAADSAAPLPVKSKAQAAAPTHRWTGLYFGGHVGYGGGSFGPGTNPAHNQGVIFP